MITVTGRVVAFVVLVCCCAFDIALVAFSAFRGGLTHREALIGTGVLVVAAVSWLWLRRENRGGGTS